MGESYAVTETPIESNEKQEASKKVKSANNIPPPRSPQNGSNAGGNGNRMPNSTIPG